MTLFPLPYSVAKIQIFALIEHTNHIMIYTISPSIIYTTFIQERNNCYGFKITNIDGEICLSLKKFDNPSYPQMFDNFTAWYEQASKLREGQISKEEYDECFQKYLILYINSLNIMNAVNNIIIIMTK